MSESNMERNMKNIIIALIVVLVCLVVALVVEEKAHAAESRSGSRNWASPTPIASHGDKRQDALLLADGNPYAGTEGDLPDTNVETQIELGGVTRATYVGEDGHRRYCFDVQSDEVGASTAQQAAPQSAAAPAPMAPATPATENKSLSQDSGSAKAKVIVNIEAN